MTSIMDYIVGLGAWNWLILAVTLFVLETVVPGVYFVWFGMAATTVGVIALNYDFAWQWQLVLFGVISMSTVFVVRFFASPDLAVSDQPDLNFRGRYYIGRLVVVETAITNGRGRVRVGDTVWGAEGPDMPTGSKAKVVGVNGTVLVIEKLDDA